MIEYIYTYGYNPSKETYEQAEHRHRRAGWLKTYKEEEMAKLDAQGRHRSQWCYAPYDGRRL